MTKYDLVSIVRPTADDSLVEEIHNNITEIITSNGGSISEQSVWQKRNLPTKLKPSTKVYTQSQPLKHPQQYQVNLIEC